MSIPLALSYLGLNRQGRQLYKASMPTTTVRAVCSIQGPSWQNGYFKLTLTDKNMQAIFCLKVILTS